MKRRIVSWIITSGFLFACLGVFTSCNKNKNDGKISIIATIFPEYDWIYNILGTQSKNIDLTLLTDSGVDLHNYQPSVADIARIGNCDLFVYVGGESDHWVDGAITGAKNADMQILKLFDILGDAVKEEEHEHEEDHEHLYDEHVWLSLQNAKTVCTAIADKLTEIDAENEEVYRANAETYLAKLTELDGQYQAVVAQATHKAFVFGDRFPFRYLAEDYGLEYYAAFSGCSAETEASFETIFSLAQTVDRLGVNAVLTTEGSDRQLAQTIVRNTTAKNQKILSLDSMQSTTAADIRNGTTYLSIMENNLNVLKVALE